MNTLIKTLAVTLAAAAFAGVAQAQSAPGAPPAEASAAKPTPAPLDTPIVDLMANPKSKAVLQKDMPGLLSHPGYEGFKGMSLHELAPHAQGQLPDDLLAKVSADITAALAQ